MKIETYTDNAAALLTLLGGTCSFDAYISSDPGLYFLSDATTEAASIEGWRDLIVQLDDEQLRDCAHGLAWALKCYWSDKFAPAALALVTEIECREWPADRKEISAALSQLMQRLFAYDQVTYQQACESVTLPFEQPVPTEQDMARLGEVKTQLQLRNAAMRRLFLSSAQEPLSAEQTDELNGVISRCGKLTL